MKKISILLTLFLFAFTLLFAQEPSAPPAPPEVDPPAVPEIKTNGDTTRFKLGDTQFIIVDDKKKSNDDEDDDMDDDEDNDNDSDDNEGINQKPGAKHKKHKAAKVGFLDFDLGWNFLINDGAPELKYNDLKLKNFRSWNYTFNFLPTEIYLGTKKAMIMTAFGWRISEHEFKNKLDFIPNKNLEYTFADTNTVKSQLVSHYLQIPLLFYFQTKKLPSVGRLGIGVGGYAGVLVHQESEIKKENTRRDIETEEDFGFAPYRYGITARIDLGYINLFANYDLNNTWEDNNMNNLECGLWFNF